MAKHSKLAIGRQAQDAFRELGWPSLLLLVVALILGGGGVRHGLTNLVVQGVALGVILIQPGLVRDFLSRAPRVLVALVVLTLLLPLVQLIPLPSGVWQALPGREMAVEARDMLGEAEGWFPITLDRARTAVALFALLGPLTAILCFSSKPEATLRHGLLLLIGLALVQFAFGVLQFGAGDALKFYTTNETGRFYGFFVGHISSGLFMVLGLCALVGHYVGSKRDTITDLLYVLCGALLVIGIILTNSRSAVALALIPLAWAGLIALRSLRNQSRKVKLGFAIGAVVALLGIGAIAATNERLATTWERFNDLEDSRPDIWNDTMSGIDRYWPIGSGMGTFDEVFQVEESLETLSVKKAARAHNEYLEIALEAGLAGLLLVGGWIAFLLYAFIRGIRSVHAPAILAAALALLCIGLQALIYFPLRNMAVLCVAGLLVALLTAPITIKRDRVID
ncbi:O-antigen ligase family protein [Qipengyuania vesicularis]|uniref:O-antigen ligase family protein n=1 Tax=Qipengyuania vesicularis TaxID=2867232 RepID=UPI001C88A108|nr:O-antigen ligase family protein [Qipengyuania vesicularis]